MIMVLRLFFNCIFFVIIGLNVFSQNVPTTIQKKSILLEEFTGIYCGNCPRGHEIARQLTYASEDAYIVVMHAGHYANPTGGDPDFRIPGGEIIDETFNDYGWPSGVINRHIFSGNEHILGTGQWLKSGKKINSQDAPVNILLTAVFDGSTRKLSINVEGYYTMEVEEEIHRLNIMVTQNNIKGPQSGAMLGDNYTHNHMLRCFITQMDEENWGDEIIEPTQGEYFEFNYEFDLPENINGIEIKPEDIEIVAFVCAGNTEVLNVTGGKPSYINFAKPLRATLLKPVKEIADTDKYGFNYFETQLNNQSHRIITSAKFEVTINNEIQEVDWTGEIPPFETKPVVIMVDPYTIYASNQYAIKLTELNDQTFAGNTITGKFVKPNEITETILIEIKTDRNADENRYLIKDADGNIVKEFGPYESNLVETYNETITLEKNATYCFEIIDYWWDGILDPRGFVKLRNDDGMLFVQALDIKLWGERIFFHTSKNNSVITSEKVNNQTTVFYNNNLQTVDISFEPIFSGITEISIYSISGIKLLEKSVLVEKGKKYEISLPVSKLSKGIYLINFNNETKKMFIN